MSVASDTASPKCSLRWQSHRTYGAYRSYKARLLAGLALLLLGAGARAQDAGTVAGLVVSTWDGTPLPGVVVTVRGTTLAGQTGADGRFELKAVPPGDQAVRFSKSGFASATVTDVRVLAGQSTTVNGSLRPEFYELEEYEVTAEVFAEQTEKIIFERQQAGTLLDAIGSEQFSRLGTSDAGQIVSRVTGVSLVGGKFVVVRGLADRYTRTLVNGAEVPSADPYRMAPQLDLFPSAMIDRINVSKTFTPDQPGGSSGGTIDIITKPFPEQPFVKGTIGTSYNPQSNLKDNFLADPNSSMRMYDLPAGPARLNPELFDLTAAPLPPGPSSSRETPARADLRRAQADAVSGLMHELGTANFAGVEETSPLNSGLSVAAGETLPLFGCPLGMFGALNYTRNFQLYESYPVAAYNGMLNLSKAGEETRSNIRTDFGANVNLGYRVSEYAEFGFNFMLAHAVDEEARHTSYSYLESREGDRMEKWQLHHTERQIQNYQLRGHHELPFLLESKLDWTVSLANTSQDEPDHRFMNYFLDSEGRPTLGDAALDVPFYPSRYFREIEEHSLTCRADWTLPLAFLQEESAFKAGFLNSSTDRDFKEMYFGYSGSDGFSAAEPNTYLNNPAYLDYSTQWLGGIRTNFNFSRYVNLAVGRPYTASQDITAGYGMVDVGVLSWLRFVGGARAERTDMVISTEREGTSRIDQLDLLPSVATVLNFTTNFDLRLSYGETVARPSFREKAPIESYDGELDMFIQGNPALQMSAIRNYDARVEWFPAPGELLSAGFFYKQLNDPIELSRVDFQTSVTYVNRAEATVMGFEFEGRKSFLFLSDRLKGLTLGGNVALIKSEVPFTSDEYYAKTNSAYHTGKSRPLYYQPPYIANMDLSYDHPTSGTSFTLAANLTGERIILTTAQGPDIYEHPPATLDAMISQKFAKYWTARFGVKNLLDPEYRQTYGANFDDPVKQAYRRGRTFSLSLTAEF